MAPNDPGPLAGGCLLAFFLLAGALTGVFMGQPSIGFLTGGGLGLAAAILVWLWNRRRRP